MQMKGKSVHKGKHLDLPKLPNSGASWEGWYTSWVPLQVILALSVSPGSYTSLLIPRLATHTVLLREVLTGSWSTLVYCHPQAGYTLGETTCGVTRCHRKWNECFSLVCWVCWEHSITLRRPPAVADSTTEPRGDGSSHLTSSAFTPAGWIYFPSQLSADKPLPGALVSGKPG